MAVGLKRSTDLSEILPSEKRQRRPSLPTPPCSDLNSPSPEPSTDDQIEILGRAAYILTVQTTALSCITDLYRTDRGVQLSLNAAVTSILSSQRAGGKLIYCAVGKSAHVARKMTATCKSLGIRTSFLHACEAMHGDLGDVRDEDIVLFVSFSGRTPELLNLLPHLPEATGILVMSGHVDAADCALLRGRPDGTLLPTPIHESEERSFGVSAPTTSTVVTLAVGDMLALTVADSLHGKSTKDVFTRHHPGGAIGMKQSNSHAVNPLTEERKRRPIVDDDGLISPEESAEDS